MWATELTDEEADRLLEKAASEVLKRKMAVPAILALEMHRPLARLAGNASVAFAPFLVPFLGFDNVNDYSRLLTRPGAVEALIMRIERDANPKKSSEDPCSITTPAG
jgi:hypothetical protein